MGPSASLLGLDAGHVCHGRQLAAVWLVPAVPYDYGSSLTYQDGNVYQGQQLVASQQDYAEQANDLAQSVPTEVQPDSVDWLPLGVFAVAEEGGKDCGMVMQLAVSKDGHGSGYLLQ